MARVTIIIGLLLCGLSAVAMVCAPLKMPALFIPMMFGIPVLFCGVVGLNPHRRRVSVGIAATIMSIAVVAAAARCGYGIALARHFVDYPVGKLVVPNVSGLPTGRVSAETIDRYASNLALTTLVISLIYVTAYLLYWLRTRRQDKPGNRQQDNDVRSERASGLSDSIVFTSEASLDSQVSQAKQIHPSSDVDHNGRVTASTSRGPCNGDTKTDVCF
jgi:hypothetical protein